MEKPKELQREPATAEALQDGLVSKREWTFYCLPMAITKVMISEKYLNQRRHLKTIKEIKRFCVSFPLLVKNVRGRGGEIFLKDGGF